MAKKDRPQSKTYQPSRYLLYRQGLKLKAPHTSDEKATAKREKKDARGAFYVEQSLKSPGKCENCGMSLGPTIAFHPRAHICHILPKELFPSVETNEHNKFFGCLNCHTCWDNAIAEKDYYIIEEMPILKTVRNRLAQFINDVAEEERRRIPKILLMNKK